MPNLIVRLTGMVIYSHESLLGVGAAAMSWLAEAKHGVLKYASAGCAGGPRNHTEGFRSRTAVQHYKIKIR